MERFSLSRSSGHQQLAQKQYTKEIKKAEKDLKKLQKKLTKDPNLLIKWLPAHLRKAAQGTWSTETVKAYVKSLPPEFVEPLVSSSASQPSYTKQIKHKMAWELFKRNITITHDKNPEKASKLYLSQKAEDDVKKRRAQGAPAEELARKRMEAHRLWQQAHQTDPAQQKTLHVMGQGAYGAARSFISGRASPISVRKALLPGASPDARRQFQEEATILKKHNHPNIIRAIPSSTAYPNKDVLAMESGGAPLSMLIQGKQTDRVKIDSVREESTRLTAEEQRQKEANTQRKDEIKQIIIDIALEHYSANDHENLLTKIQNLCEQASFNRQDLDDLLNIINRWQSTSSKPDDRQLLAQLRGDFEVRKAEIPLQRSFGGALSINNIKHTGRQIADGVAYLHQQKRVHSDLKPDNVLIKPDGTVKIIDFGLSRSLEAHEEANHPSGSPAYMAPEVLNLLFKNHRYPQKITEKTDVYSTGCLLYELAIGEFYNDVKGRVNSKRELLNKLMHNAVTDKDKMYKKMSYKIMQRYPNDRKKAIELEHLLKGMLEPNPTKRLSMEEVRKHPFFSD